MTEPCAYRIALDVKPLSAMQIGYFAQRGLKGKQHRARRIGCHIPGRTADPVGRAAPVEMKLRTSADTREATEPGGPVPLGQRRPAKRGGHLGSRAVHAGAMRNAAGAGPGRAGPGRAGPAYAADRDHGRDRAGQHARKTLNEGESMATFGTLEGTGFEVFEPEFRACLAGPERVARLWTGGRWCEGPAWFAAHGTLVWSDIPNNRMLRLDELNGTVGVFRERSNHSNGNTVDREGRLVTCEHLTRRVTRTEHDGRITVLADRWQGKRLNSPNDVVVRSDGSVWFTDPSYGILSDYEGEPAESEIGACHVYRIDPLTTAVSQVADDFVKPICATSSLYAIHLKVNGL